MRCDQHMGLNEWVKRFVEGCGSPHYFGESKPVVVALGSDHETTTIEVSSLEPCVRKEESGEFYHGMFEGADPYPLYKYTLRDGRVFYEWVQAEPWSSGPVFFLALTAFAPSSREYMMAERRDLTEEEARRFVVPESLWPEEAIANA